MSPLRTRLTPPIALAALGAGFSSVGMPLWLHEAGMSKTAIATFFVVGAVSAAFINLRFGRHIRRRGHEGRDLSNACLVAGAGFLVLQAAPVSSWFAFGAAPLTLAVSLVFPSALGALADTSEGATMSVARSRQVFVVAFACGLGAAGLVETIGVAFPMVAALFAVATGVSCRTARWPGRRPESAPTPATDRNPVLRVLPAALLFTIGAVFLMRAADAVRMTYFPLVGTALGFNPSFVALTFVATTVCELVVARPLARAATRLGTMRPLVIVCLVGALAFVVIPIRTDGTTVVISQIVYGVYAMGFQSLGIGLLSDALGDVSAGASAFTIILQAGTVFGVVLPSLFTTGYTNTVFLVGAALAGGAALLLVTRSAWSPRPAHTVRTRDGGTS